MTDLPPPTDARRTRRRRMAAVVLGAGLLLGCLSGEVVARLAIPESDLSGDLYRDDPDTGFALAPGPHGPGVVISSHGLRDPERPIDKPAGVRRVLVLGDSFAYAASVAMEDGFARVLERRLGPGAQVIDSGVPGWGPVQQAAWLKREGPRWRPDVVVVAFFVGNDVFESAGDARRLKVVDGQLVADERAERSASSWRDLRNRSRLYRVVKTIPEAVRDRMTGDTRAARKYHEIELLRLGLCDREPAAQATWEPGWRVAREKLAEIRDLAAPAKVVVMVIPDEYQVSDELLQAVCARAQVDPARYDLALPQRRLAAITAELGLETIDLLPDLRRRTQAGERLYIPLDSHWNAAGHALAADALLASSTVAPR